ncbi:hypothetical protein BSLG_005659 [Batrachochytrium salamandrivorans]|nr:hypothetical protein BSLG_005659 [Batrachochytrium salamandrivorans]
MVIEEGTRMIDDARLKWTESELKFKTQEDMIAVEEESIKYQSEIRRLKLSFEEQETKSKMEYVELEKKLQEAMLDNQKQFAERDSAISELQNLSAEKDSHIQDLENKSDDLKALTESAEKVSRLLVDKTTEQELEDILSKLAVSEQQIREAEIAYQQSNNQIKSLEEEVALVSDDLIKSNEYAILSYTKIVGLEEDLQALEQKRVEDLKEAVEKLTKTMEADKIDSIAALKSNMESSQKEAELLKLENLMATVNTLEVDKADLFQKMVHIDRQIQAEMRNQHHTDIQNLKDTINQDHEQELQAWCFCLQTEVLAKLETDHINGLAHQKQRLEELMKQKENDLSIASACAISDLEKQHATTLAESEITHKKQLDDLRNFHTVSVFHQKERTKMLSDLEADLSAKMKSEIEKVVKKWTLIVQAREDQIQTQSEDIIAKQEQINLLKQQIQVLESNLAGALKKAESRKILEESVIQFEADLQGD